jgi:hypothetical protein
MSNYFMVANFLLRGSREMLVKLNQLFVSVYLPVQSYIALILMTSISLNLTLCPSVSSGWFIARIVA